MTATVNASSVLKMLNDNTETIRACYDHIKQPFTLAEAQDFVDGKPGKTLKYGTRSRQIAQAVSAIGACVVAQNLATPSTVVTYQALWAIDKKETCKYCGKAFTFRFMGGSNRGVCNKAKCTLNSMRESI